MKWKTSLIIGMIWEVMAVWYLIVAIKSDEIKPVIVSAKVKWLTVVGWNNRIIQDGENSKSLLIADHLCWEFSLTKSVNLSRVWALISFKISIDLWQNHKWYYISLAVLHLQQYHEAL